MDMLTIGAYVAKTVAPYAAKKAFNSFIKNRKSFEFRLSKVINKTIDEFKSDNPISVDDGKISFYNSQIFFDELLKYKFFSKKGYQLDEERISSKLEKNPNIILPEINQIKSFLIFFEQNIQDDAQLKKLAEDENFKSEIFLFSEKLDKLLDGLSKNPKEIPKELTPITPISKKDIVGRKADLENLRNFLLQENDTALINGMGGIGKTTLAAVYISEYYEHYDHIAWLTIENSLEEAIASNYSLLTNLKIKDTPPAEQLNACLNKLRTLESEKPKLLVIDNAKENLSEHYPNLPKAPGWHLLVTSSERIANFHKIDLDFLTEDEAIELFNKYNSNFTGEQVRGIVKCVELHTLTIEILAKSASKNRWDLETVESALTCDAKAGIDITYCKNKVDRIQTYLSGIFDISKLSDNETYLLKQFTALPNQWIKYDLLSVLLQKEELDWKEEFAGTLESIYDKGFILKDSDTDRYKMHPVLVEALTSSLNIVIDDIMLLITSVGELLSIDQAKDNPIDKFQFIPYGDAILKQYSDNTSVETSELKNYMAIVYKELGEYEKARGLLEEALQSDVKNFEANHPTIARCQSNLAVVYKDLGEYEKARDLLEEALQSAEENYEANHPAIAVSQSILGLVYSDLGENEKARDLLEEALQSDLDNFNANHPNISVRQSNLAGVYRNLGEYEKARGLLEEALQSDLENFEANHPAITRCQSNLAVVYSDLGENEKARDLLEEALKSDLENFGSNHPNIAIDQSILGLVYSDLGENEKARDLLEEALQSDLKNFEVNHPNIAVRQSNLANVYLSMGENEKARDLLEEALKSDLENFGSNHPNIAISQSNLATVYQSMGEYEKARDLLEDALRSAKENFEGNHPTIAISQSNLATVYQSMGEYEKARGLLEEALKSDLENFGSNHPNIAIGQSILGLVYSDLGENEKARDLWTKSYDIFISALGEKHPHTKTVKEFLDNLDNE